MWKADGNKVVDEKGNTVCEVTPDAADPNRTARIATADEAHAAMDDFINNKPGWRARMRAVLAARGG